jgi:hypothetical protein
MHSNAAGARLLEQNADLKRSDGYSPVVFSRSPLCGIRYEISVSNAW